MSPEEIRAAALLAASRGAVNPGVVIENAKRFAHYIGTGRDVNEVSEASLPCGHVESDRCGCPERSGTWCVCGHDYSWHSGIGCEAVIDHGLSCICQRFRELS